MPRTVPSKLVGPGYKFPRLPSLLPSPGFLFNYTISLELNPVFPLLKFVRLGLLRWPTRDILQIKVAGNKIKLLQIKKTLLQMK